MSTANERKALWFLALVALSGSGVRLWRANTTPPPATESAALARQIQRSESARAARAVRGVPPRSTRSAGGPPKAPVVSEDSVDIPVDLDRANATELEKLPGIGPALAQRIVANRDSLGSFGHIEALCEIRGVGPVLLQKLRPLVTFTGARRPVSDECGAASKRSKKRRVADRRDPS